MIRKKNSFFKRFGREEDGNMTIEFALAIPLVFSIFMASTEMGLYQIRQMFLDRGVDMAIRNVRLNTGANLSHADLKDMVCDYAGLLENCNSDLRLSMNPVDLRTYSGPTGSPSDCNNTYPDISPLRNFVHGGEHQMMLIVACYDFRVIFPTTKVGYSWGEDNTARMFGFSGFVQEPS